MKRSVTPLCWGTPDVLRYKIEVNHINYFYFQVHFQPWMTLQCGERDDNNTQLKKTTNQQIYSLTPQLQDWIFYCLEIKEFYLDSENCLQLFVHFHALKNSHSWILSLSINGVS